jgi:hypothetical protein
MLDVAMELADDVQMAIERSDQAGIPLTDEYAKKLSLQAQTAIAYALIAIARNQ